MTSVGCSSAVSSTLGSVVVFAGVASSVTSSVLGSSGGASACSVSGVSAFCIYSKIYCNIIISVNFLVRLTRIFF